MIISCELVPRQPSCTVMSMDSQLDIACSGNRSPKAAVDNKHTHGTKDINILILGKRDVGKTGKDVLGLVVDIRLRNY